MEKQLYIQPRIEICRDNHPDSQTEYYDNLTIILIPEWFTKLQKNQKI